MRWAVLLGVAVPLVLGLALLIARLGGNQELARSCARALRIVLAIETVALVIIAIVGSRYEHRARRQDAAQFHPPGKLVDIGGYRLHLNCTGAGGPTVILEHGHRATYLDWYPVQSKLSEFTRVCSFDRGGHGWSDPSPGTRVPTVMAEELRTLLRSAGEKPPYILVGHSFGGLNSIMFAHKFPREVAAIVLVDTPHPEALRPASRRTRTWLRLIQLTSPFGLPRWRGWCDGGPEETLAVKRALTCRSQNIETILREDAAFPVSTSELRGIASLGDLPLVVIARDPVLGRDAALEARHTEQQLELTSLSSNSKYLVAEGSGHDVPLARPDVVVQALRTLLKPQEQADSRETP